MNTATRIKFIACQKLLFTFVSKVYTVKRRSPEKGQASMLYERPPVLGLSQLPLVSCSTIQGQRLKPGNGQTLNMPHREEMWGEVAAKNTFGTWVGRGDYENQENGVIRRLKRFQETFSGVRKRVTLKISRLEKVEMRISKQSDEDYVGFRITELWGQLSVKQKKWTVWGRTPPSQSPQSPYRVLEEGSPNSPLPPWLLFSDSQLVIIAFLW